MGSFWLDSLDFHNSFQGLAKPCAEVSLSVFAQLALQQILCLLLIHWLINSQQSLYLGFYRWYFQNLACRRYYQNNNNHVSSILPNGTISI